MYFVLVTGEAGIVFITINSATYVYI